MKRNSAINLFMSFLLISQSVPETFGVQAFASSISETTQKNDTKRKDSSDTQARSVTASKNESLVRVADKQSRLTTFDNRSFRLGQSLGIDPSADDYGGESIRRFMADYYNDESYYTYGEATLKNSFGTTQMWGDNAGTVTYKFHRRLEPDADYVIHYRVNYGDTINILGKDNVRAYSLSAFGNVLRLTHDNSTQQIDPAYSGEYMKIQLFRATTDPLNELEGKYYPVVSSSYKGTEKVSNIEQNKQFTNLLQAGDIVHLFVKDRTRVTSYVENVKQNSIDTRSGERVKNFVWDGSDFKELYVQSLEVNNEPTISVGMSHSDLDKLVESYVPDLKYFRVGGVEVHGFSQYPDTSKEGSTKAKIRVKQYVGGRWYYNDLEIPFKVKKAISKVEAVPQTFDYASTLGSLDSAALKKFVTVYDAEGKTTDEFDIKLVSYPDMVSSTSETLKVEVTAWDTNNAEKYTVAVPYQLKRGSQILLYGISDREVARFTLSGDGNKIVATYDGSKGNNTIHSYFSNQQYYAYNQYNVSAKDVVLNSDKSDYNYAANGDDLINSLEKFGNKREQTVKAGGVIKISHEEPARHTFWENETESNPAGGLTDTFYQVLNDKFEMIPINKITVKKQTVELGNSKSQMDAKLADYLKNDTGFNWLEIEKFISYPDTSKLGTTEATIRVRLETRANHYASFDYKVPFEVVPRISKVEAKQQTLTYGSLSTDFNLKNMVTVYDAAGKQTSDFDATLVSFPNMISSNQKIVVRVTAWYSNNTEIYDVEIPYQLKRGSQITLRGQGDFEIARFTLNNAGNKIVATYDGAKAGYHVHDYFPAQQYYGFNQYKASEKDVLLNSDAATYSFSVNGDDYVSKLDKFGTNRQQEVKAGDIIKIQHEEPNNRHTFWENETETKGSAGFKDTYYQVLDDKLEIVPINRITVTKQTIELGNSKGQIDAKLSSYLKNDTGFEHLEIEKFVSYPDTSKLGDTEATIRVRHQTKAKHYVYYDYKVPFEVVPRISKIEPKNQTLDYANLQADVTDNELRNFVRVYNQAGQVTNDFDIKLLNYPDMITSTSDIKVEVTAWYSNTVEKYEVVIPTTVKRGSQITLRGIGDKEVARFTLNSKLNKIVATYSDSSDSIHSYFGGDDYYTFNQYTSSAKDVALQTDAPNYVFHGIGTAPISSLKNFGNQRQQPVSVGDLISIYHAESGQRHTFWEDEKESQPHDGNQTMYYQVLSDKIQPLPINQISLSKHEIPYCMSTADLDATIAQYLVNDTGYKDISVDKFIAYPDTSKAGDTTGTIRVKSQLQSGKFAYFDYVVPFEVGKRPELNVTIPIDTKFEVSDKTRLVRSPKYSFTNNSTYSGVKANVEKLVIHEDSGINLISTTAVPPANQESLILRLNMKNKTEEQAVSMTAGFINDKGLLISPNEQMIVFYDGQFFGELTTIKKKVSATTQLKFTVTNP